MQSHQQNSAMQLQNQSASMQLNPLTNLQKFLSNYNNFIQQHTTLQLNTQTILQDIALNILKPPSNDQQLQSLYQAGKSLPRLLNTASIQTHEVFSSLKRLKEDKIYDTILMIEELNHKLNRDFEEEVNRGIDIGVYTRKVTGEIVSGRLDNIGLKEETEHKGDIFMEGRSERVSDVPATLHYALEKQGPSLR